MSALDTLPCRHWTVEEFQRAARAGVFGEDERLELLFGEIVPAVPPDPPHAISIPLGLVALQRLFLSPDAHLRTENPMVIPGDGQPEPDILAVRGTPRDYRDRHPQPSDVLLLIEVSDSTLAIPLADPGATVAVADLLP